MKSYLSERIRLHVSKVPWSNRMDFLVQELVVPGVHHEAVGVNIEMKTLTEEEMGMEISPTFSLSGIAVQELMDELWAAGIRPSCKGDSQGHFEAMQKHLTDMRRIVFGTLELPQEKDNG